MLRENLKMVVELTSGKNNRSFDAQTDEACDVAAEMAYCLTSVRLDACLQVITGCCIMNKLLTTIMHNGR